jgi:hypothetical protein
MDNTKVATVDNTKDRIFAMFFLRRLESAEPLADRLPVINTTCSK